MATTQPGIKLPGTQLTLHVEPWGPTGEQLQAHAAVILKHAAVQEHLQGKQFRSLRTEMVYSDSKDGADKHPPTRYLQYIYNYTEGETLVVEGDVNNQTPVSIRKSSIQPLPTAEEFNEAVKVIFAKEADIKAALLSGELTVQRPMPPLVARPLRNGRTERIVNVGLLSLNDHEPYAIMGVNLAAGTVERVPKTFSPRTTHPWQQGQANLESLSTAVRPTDLAHILIPVILATGPGQFWFTLSDAHGKAVWRFLAVRPANSSGLNGSGLEIRYADYKGKRVLYLGHLPILTVLYAPPDNTEFRDWQNSEAGFDAVGTDLAPGFRLCLSPPKTVFETGKDGPYFGVAAYHDANSLTVSTMMQAGWYRYFMSWSFTLDGRVLPRVGFTTNGFNPHQGHRHNHHAYLRLDLDIGTPGNNLIAEDYTRVVHRPFPFPPLLLPVHDVYAFETEVLRAAVLKPSWTVSNAVTKDAYRLTPRAMDGSASGDAFGVSDVWALHYRGTEIDDGVARLTHPAHVQLDKFVNHESLDRQDVVLWYGMHFLHDPAVAHGEKDLGPDLAPVHW